MLDKTVRNIVFDFGCVLVDLDKARCLEAFDRLGAHALAQYVDECRQEDLFRELELGHTTPEEFCNEARQKAHITATDQQLCDAWRALLVGIPVRRIQALLHLRQYYRLAVLSNTNIIHWKQAVDDFFPYRGMNVSDYFDHIFLSFEMHKTKPDRAIFEQMLHEADMEADETLFIDDSEANCAAARSIGIHTLHVSHGDEWLDLLKDELK